MMIFISIFTLGLYFMSLYVVFRTFTAIDFQPKLIVLLITAGLVAILQALVFFEFRTGHEHYQAPLIRVLIAYLLLGTLVTLFLYFFFADVAAWISRRLLGPIDFDWEKRLFFGTLIAGGASSIAGWLKSAQGAQIVATEVPLPEGKFKNLSGIKIAQITDLHVGPLIGKKYVESVVEKTLAFKPDLVFLTGDFVDGGISQLEEAIEPLFKLSAPLGVYFVTGNHEYYSGADAWISHFKKKGITVLENSHQVLEVKGEKLVIAGVYDFKSESAHPSHRFDPELSLKGSPSEAYKIFLSHQPKGYEIASKLGVNLQFSGHTHAGQFFPWSLIVPLVYRYYRGLNRFENLWIYVGAGTGYWGPPNRLFNRSEIGFVTLT